MKGCRIPDRKIDAPAAVPGGGAAYSGLEAHLAEKARAFGYEILDHWMRDHPNRRDWDLDEMGEFFRARFRELKATNVVVELTRDAAGGVHFVVSFRPRKAAWLDG